MSICGGGRKRKLECGSLNVGADAFIGNDLTVIGDVNVDGTISGGVVFPDLLRIKDGTAANPSLSFNAAQQTGIYRDTLNSPQDVGVSVSGTKRLKVSDS